jgi:hypothetical protein
VPDTTLLVLFWILLGISLFGLLRLSIARRGTDQDWQGLVAFGRRLPADFRESVSDPGRWTRALASAPAGLLPPLERSPESTEAPTLPPDVVQERIRDYQAMLQSEMKWFAHRMTNPLQWFAAGIRGLLLLPLGLPLDFDAKGRARRRALESDPAFQRVVYAILGICAFVTLVACVFGARSGILWLRHGLRE